MRQQVGEAQDPPNSVVEMKQSGIDAANPPETVWTDPATANELILSVSYGGKVVTWQHQYLDSHRVINLDDTEVDYGPRTWSYRTENFGSPISGPAPTAPVIGVSYFPATMLKNMLDQGTVKIVGHPVVDGHHTVELSVSLGKQGKAEQTTSMSTARPFSWSGWFGCSPRTHPTRLPRRAATPGCSAPRR